MIPMILKIFLKYDFSFKKTLTYTYIGDKLELR